MIRQQYREDHPWKQNGGETVKSKALSVLVGSVVILIMGTFASMFLAAYYGGDIPLAAAMLAPLLCSLGGGCIAAHIAQSWELVIGALSGLIAGLIVVGLAALFAGLAMTVAAILVAGIFVVGGASGGGLARIRFSPRGTRTRYRDERAGQCAGSVAWPPMP